MLLIYNVIKKLIHAWKSKQKTKTLHVRKFKLIIVKLGKISTNFKGVVFT